MLLNYLLILLAFVKLDEIFRLFHKMCWYLKILNCIIFFFFVWWMHLICIIKTWKCITKYIMSDWKKKKFLLVFEIQILTRFERLQISIFIIKNCKFNISYITFFSLLKFYITNLFNDIKTCILIIYRYMKIEQIEFNIFVSQPFSLHYATVYSIYCSFRFKLEL